MIIPAAGQARRFGSGENKIWALLAGRSVLARTLAAFQDHPRITCIVIASSAEERERVTDAASAFSKVIAVVQGGAARSDSVRCALEQIPPYCGMALVHDAARPLVSAELIDRVIDATIQVGAAVPGLPVSDTVKRVDSQGRVRATVFRSVTLEGETIVGLTAVQTPQGARISLLRTAYARYDFSYAQPTDEASLIEALGKPVASVAGDPYNLKITRKEDIKLAEALLQQGAGDKIETSTTEFRTGFGYDVHAFAAPEAGRKLFLGGVEIPYDRGLEGHSDADVLLHAVCDALLGAVGIGDIGILFPNTDPAFEGISSLKLLKIVADHILRAGWQIVNIDAAVVAEAPKLSPHRVAMRHEMAGCLGIVPERISIKATTSEKLGFIGRREGIECSAVATVKSNIRMNSDRIIQG